METTVQDLRRARLRHLLLGVVLALASLLIWRLGVAVALMPGIGQRGVAVRASHFGIGVAPTERALEIITLVTATTTVLAVYHLWQWRRKTRRYQYQRRRAANELLRADFKATGRV
jgi:hypothetical protein